MFSFYDGQLLPSTEAVCAEKVCSLDLLDAPDISSVSDCICYVQMMSVSR